MGHQRVKNSSLITLLVSLFIGPTAVEMRAQTNEGILAGTALDPSGAAVEGAEVSARNEGTGQTLTTTSGSGGTFRFPFIPIGKYDVTVAHPGFNSPSQTGVTVEISTTTALTLTLAVGRAEQTVTVQADVTTIETETSDIRTVIDSKQVVELPLALGGVGALRSPEALCSCAWNHRSGNWQQQQWDIHF